MQCTWQTHRPTIDSNSNECHHREKTNSCERSRKE